jgi:hypothetical protein
MKVKMKMIDFEKIHVGNIIFFSKKGSVQLISLQVIEEITKKSLAGIEKDFKVIEATESQQQSYLKKYLNEGDVFLNVHDAQEFMMKNATAAIDRIIKNACTQAEGAFSSGRFISNDIHAKNDDYDIPELPVESKKTKVILPDGTVANLVI